MTANIEDLPQLSFDGISFPYEKISVKGALRDHTHEYPHVDLGANEKLGTKNYIINVDAKFLASYVDPQWKNNWPGALALLIQKFEQKLTAELVVPNLGTLKAYATEWDREINVRMRSGESTKFTFKQDDKDVFINAGFLRSSQAAVSSAASTLVLLVDPQDELSPASALPSTERKQVGGLLSGIQSTVGSITGLMDRVDMYSSAIQDKMLTLASLCSQLEAVGDVFRDPRNHREAAAVRALWAASLTAAGTSESKGLKLITYVVPVDQAVGDISRRLYGTPQRGVDILRLNPVDDAFRVPAGTRLRVPDPKAV